MSSLITGANGFLGSALTRVLCTRGTQRVRCLARPGSELSRLRGLLDGAGSARPELFRGSLATPDDAAKALQGVDTVYHLAAAMNGSAADMCLGTVVASKNLLEASIRMQPRPRLVLVSSFSVYGTAGLRRGTCLDEETPLESRPALRDLYSQTKLRQEALFWEYQRRFDLELVVLRPGVIYGPGGAGLSARVGVQLPGCFLHLGRDNRLPLSYVDNCAEALALAGTSNQALARAWNVHDDELPTCREYLEAYASQLGEPRSLTLPYPAVLVASYFVDQYHRRSGGQLPAFFTPYRTRSLWKGLCFDNSRLKSLGWQPRVSTADGMRRTFQALKAAQRSAN